MLPGRPGAADIVGVTLSHSARTTGRSGYTIAKMWGVFGNLLINHSSLLLRLVGQAGVCFAMLSFLAAGWVTYRRLAQQIAVAGWASLLVVNLLLGGLILFAIGVIGEYLIRIIETSGSRSAYHVRRRVGPPGGVGTGEPESSVGPVDCAIVPERADS